VRGPATLVLADGASFEGWAAGADAGVVSGEFVFNTALSGYQEVLTDPSYAGQVVAFTYPHLGNYGVTAADDESARPWVSGVVARELSGRPSNHRAEGTLEDYLTRHGVAAIVGVDTRRLTRHLRSSGALPGAFGPGDPGEVAAAARAALGTDGRDLVRDVTTAEAYSLGSGPTHVVVLDYGVKRSALARLAARHRVTVAPASLSAGEVLALEPDGVMLSNGPGDPAALGAQAAVVAGLVGATPVFGICLGHQLLAAALGARTYKLPFGHHGSNHPVKDLATGRVEITAQNHNYAVDAAGLGRGVVSHVNLYDGVVEGLDYPGERCFSVQYHPEAGPGPHDARYLFDRFAALVEASR
jgi:carbamoyl-phosphate synthase small subunit